MSSTPNSLLDEASRGPHVLGEDERWSGAVELTRDVLIPEGRRLLLAGDARVWTKAGKRPARLFVYGTLESEPGAVLGAASPLGGVFAQGAGVVRLRGSALNAASDAEPAALVEEAAVFEWDGGSLRASGAGLLCRGRAKLSRLELAGCAQGLVVEAGFLEAQSCRLTGARDLGLRVEAKGWARAVDCVFSGSAKGALSRGGRLTLERCVLRGLDEGARCQGGEAFVSDCRFEECRTGLIADGGRIAARGASARDCSTAGAAVSGGSLSWREGRVSGGSAGLETDGGSLDCAGTLFVGPKVGARVANGTLKAEGATWRECSRAAVELTGSEAALDGCAADDCAAGVEASTSVLNVEGSAFSGCKCAVAMDGGELVWSRGTASGCGEAISARAASARVEDVSFEDCGVGASVAGGSFSLDSARLSRCGVGLEAGEAAVQLAKVELESCGVAVSARETDVSWRGGAAVGGSLALRSRGSRTSLSDVSFLGQPQSADVVGGSLDAAGLVVRAERVALGLEGAAVRLLDAKLSGPHLGCAARGGTLSLDGAELSGFSTALSLESGAGLSVSRASFEACRAGVDAVDSRVALGEDVDFAGCARPMSLAGEAAADVAPGQPARLSAPAPARDALRRFVLATEAGFFWRPVWRLAYAAGAAAVGLWARFWGAEGAWLYRGSASSDWRPGVSDLDVVVCAGGLNGEAGRARLGAARRALRALRACFPFLGEVLVVEPADSRLYAAWGGARAGEWGAGVRLAGALPAPTGAQPAPLASLTECAHALTRLSQWSLSVPAEPWPVARRQLFKAGLDAARWAEAARRGLRAEARAQAWACLTGPAREALEPFADGAREPGPADKEAAAAALYAQTVRLLEPAAAAVLGSRPGEAPARGRAPARAADRAAEAAAAAAVQSFRRALGGAPVAVVADGLHRAVAAVDEAALDASLEPRLRGWLAAARLEAAARPLVCGPKFFAAWHWTAYADCPTRWLDAPEEGGAVCAGALWPGRVLLRWGAAPPAPPASLLAEAARESWANLRATWRVVSRESELQPPEALAHHLLGRTLGLSLLLERGEARSFFDVDALAAEAGFSPAGFDLGGGAMDALDALYPSLDARLRSLPS